MTEKEIGKITHFFNKISVGVIELKDTLKDGDTIHIKGATTDFKQTARSMQIEHDKIEEAKAGQSIGLKVNEQVRQGDLVYKVTAGEEKPKVKLAKAKPVKAKAKAKPKAKPAKAKKSKAKPKAKAKAPAKKKKKSKKK